MNISVCSYFNNTAIVVRVIYYLLPYGFDDLDVPFTPHTTMCMLLCIKYT